MTERILDEINLMLDGYINVQKHRWEKQMTMKNYKRAEETHLNLNLLRKIKKQINTIIEENK